MQPPHTLRQITTQAKTKTFGKNACEYEQCDSTNTRAMELARQGAVEGTLVIAERQEHGRGRLGRSWTGTPGKSLLFTLLLRPPLSAATASHTTLLMAVAVAKAVRRVAEVPADIKWPNDLVVGGRKFCGILVEMQGQVEQVDFLAVGVGVNVNQAREDFPEELRHLATSLALERGKALDRLDLLAAIMEEAEALYKLYLRDGAVVVTHEWGRYSCMTSRSVRATLPGGRVIEGMALGIDPDGALLVRIDNGVVERLVAGDVTLS